jgi:predicted porin
MKKNLITAATMLSLTCGAITEVVADDETQVYARIRVALQNTDDGMNIDNFTSRIGIKGSTSTAYEGLKMIYRAEWQADEKDTNDNGNLSKTRLFWAGVTGDYGTLKLGQMWSPYWVNTVKDINVVFQTKQFQLGMASPKVFSYRRGNSVSYATKTMNGFQASALIQVDTNNELTEEGIDQSQIGFNYSVGGLKIGAAYLNNNVTDNGNRASLTASYKTGQFKFTAMYSDVEISATEGNTNPWAVAGTYAMGKTNVLAMYYDDDNTAKAATYGDGWGIEVQHKLSKKSMVYIGAGDNGYKNSGGLLSIGTRIDF